MTKNTIVSIIFSLMGGYGFLSFSHYLLKVPGTAFSFNPNVMFGDFLFGIEFLFSISNPIWLALIVLFGWMWIIFRLTHQLLTKASAS